MTPKELRSAIDESWPVEIRFLIEKAADNWSESLRHEEIIQSDLVKVIRDQNKKMSGKLLSRMRAKKWSIAIDGAEQVCKDVEEGFEYFSAEKVKNETQETRHPETDGRDQPSTKT